MAALDEDVAQARRLVGVEVGEHLALDLVDCAVAALERAAPGPRELDADHAAVSRLGQSPDVALLGQEREHLAHRLGRDERAARETRVGEPVLCAQHRERGVGGQRQARGLDRSREAAAQDAVEAADHVAQPRLHVRSRPAARRSAAPA